MRQAIEAGQDCALATLYRVEGSAPRGPGAQMLFTGTRASGYFSGDCVEGDVASHAAEVLADGKPQRLHYGLGSPWIDIRLRCGGALYILLERIAADSPAALDLLACANQRRSCRWSSDGMVQTIGAGEGPLVTFREDPLHVSRRYDPPRRIIVSGGDPGALAMAQLAADAQFETVLVRPGGPDAAPPLRNVQYIRAEPADALAELGMDRWTAYIGATHEDHHDLAACLHALRHGAGYVGMIGARSRAPGRIEALRAAGATEEELDRLNLSPGMTGLGKAPWEVATGIMAHVMQALNPSRERA
ncbi:MAG: XdhC family protein [Novosphingobium sp.]|nr:XdhC family protein [Novosphingobium sp.]